MRQSAKGMRLVLSDVHCGFGTLNRGADCVQFLVPTLHTRTTK